MTESYESVFNTSKKQRTGLRTGAYIVAIGRVVKALTLWGIYP